MYRSSASCSTSRAFYDDVYPDGIRREGPVIDRKARLIAVPNVDDPRRGLATPMVRTLEGFDFRFVTTASDYRISRKRSIKREPSLLRERLETAHPHAYLITTKAAQWTFKVQTRTHHQERRRCRHPIQRGRHP